MDSKWWSPENIKHALMSFQMSFEWIFKGALWIIEGVGWAFILGPLVIFFARCCLIIFQLGKGSLTRTEISWGLIWSKMYHVDSLGFQTDGIVASPIYGKSVLQHKSHGLTLIFTRPGYREYPLYLRANYKCQSPKIKDTIN